ncbi:hypothetical protein Tco_0592255, partial [Tanacetum coccineum]
PVYSGVGDAKTAICGSRSSLGMLEHSGINPQIAERDFPRVEEPVA